MWTPSRWGTMDSRKIRMLAPLVRVATNAVALWIAARAVDGVEIEGLAR